jgi:hypothetical protein
MYCGTIPLEHRKVSQGDLEGAELLDGSAGLEGSELMEGSTGLEGSELLEGSTGLEGSELLDGSVTLECVGLGVTEQGMTMESSYKMHSCCTRTPPSGQSRRLSAVKLAW